MAGFEKTITIDGIDVTFYCSAATPIHYRRLFHRDLMLEMQNMQSIKNGKAEMTAENMEMLDCCAFIMARQAAERHGVPFPSSLEEWADQFSMMSLQTAYPTIFELWARNNVTIVKPKKEDDGQNAS